MSWLSQHKGAVAGVYGGPVGVAAGAAYDERQRKNKRKNRLQSQRNSKDYAGDPNVAAIYEAGDEVGASGGDWADYEREFAKRYRGSSKHLATHLQRFRPLIMSQLLKTKAARDLLEGNEYARSAYAPGANMIERSVSEGMRSMRGGLAMSGLTAGGAYPGLEASMRFQAASARGALLNQVQSEQMMMRFNLQQQVAAMGAGIPFTPAAPRQDNSGMWALLAGQLAQAGATVGASALGGKE